jgi:pimeloyl-ACP methyl ester carboxylesterase
VIRALVAGGYAVVVIDVRGTGGSEGEWRFPWSGDEIADSGLPDAYEQVAKRRGVQDARVVDDDEAHGQ